ncbi:TnsA endonuclease N-terminal domain-containing protein [Peribacillus frigoritolerans]
MTKHHLITHSKVKKMKDLKNRLGNGRNYKPLLTVRNVPSKGFSHRIKGWKTARVHHLFSNLELSFFFSLEWSGTVIDIRERFPLLPIEKTIEIANRFDIKHPYDPKTNEPILMTTDFLTDQKVNSEVHQIAFSVVPSSKQNNRRFLEKSLIEKVYWKEQGAGFHIITDEDISLELAENLRWLHDAKDATYSPGLSENEIFEIEHIITGKSKLTVLKACKEVDIFLNLRPGVSLWVVQYLIANRIWLVDITKVIKLNEPLKYIRNTMLIKARNQGS